MYRENARKRRNIFVRAIIWPISIFLVGRFKGHLSQIILNLELIMINSAEYSREFFLGSRFCKWLLTKHDLAAKQQEKTFWKKWWLLAAFSIYLRKRRDCKTWFFNCTQNYDIFYETPYSFNQVHLKFLKFWNNFKIRNR